MTSGWTIAKLTRSPLNKTRRRSKPSLQLVHSDVCGPSNVTAYDGKRYFATFIDEYTHMLVTYLIEWKSEVFECFKEFKATSQSQNSIQVVKIDIVSLRASAGRVLNTLQDIFQS